jgi:hypothetical protein
MRTDHTTTTPDAALSELRSLLHRPPCPLVWAEVCALLSRCAHDEAARERLVPYTQELLRAWPDRSRTSPAHWVRMTLLGERCGLWPLVRHLYHVGPLGERGLQALLTCAELGPITHITIHGSDLRDGGARLLARWAADLALVTVSLPHNDLGPRGVAALAHSALLARVHHLDLSDNDLRPGCLDALLPAIPHVERISLARNPLGERGARKIADALGALPRLRALDLTGCGLDDGAAASLLQRAITENPALRVELGAHEQEPHP